MTHSTYKCIHCDKENKKRGIQYKNRFCNNECSAAYQTAKCKREWYEGKKKSLVRKTIKRYLTEDRGYKCEKCGINKWKGELLSLELDHIDGNASDDAPTNVRLLCPNCHAITPTWKGRNKGNGRKSRGLLLN